MKITLRSEALSLTLILMMFVVAAVSWSVVPDRIPVHWGPDGQPDRYGGKFEGLLLIPLITLGVYLVLVFLPRIDPRREHYGSFAGAYITVRTAIVAVLAAVHLFAVLWTRGHPVDMLLTLVLTGMLFVVLGNYLPKVRSNWFVGFRDPWTLSSEESWRKTNRLGGKLFLLTGVVLITVGLMRPAPIGWAIAAIVFLVAASFGLSVYSYLIWRQDRHRQSLS